jgi:hypothetical protein
MGEVGGVLFLGKVLTPSQPPPFLILKMGEEEPGKRKRYAF